MLIEHPCQDTLMSNNSCQICECISNNADSYIAAVGLLFGFLSIVLSIVAIRITCKVQKEVVLQKFKEKQQEVMSSLSYTLNTTIYHIKFGDVLTRRMNFKGMETALKDEKSDFAKYKDGNLSYIGASPLHSFSCYWGISYLPPDVSTEINNFTKFVDSASNNKSSGCHVTILNTGREPYVDENKEEHISLNCSWGEFVNKISSLISMIEKWYRNEYNQKDFKMPSCIMNVEFDKNG